MQKIAKSPYLVAWALALAFALDFPLAAALRLAAGLTD